MTQLETHRDVMDRIGATIPGRCEGKPLFRAPWQARVFALIVGLVQAGHLPWRGFQARLAQAITEMEALGAPDAVEDGYFECWLRATEDTLDAERLIGPDETDAQITQLRDTIAAIRASQTAQG